MTIDKTADQLVREEIERRVLEKAATLLEKYDTNEIYRKALKLGAKLIRGMKNEL